MSVPLAGRTSPVVRFMGVVAITAVCMAAVSCERTSTEEPAGKDPQARDTVHADQAGPPRDLPPGHQRMLKHLKKIADRTPNEHPFLGSLKARQLKRRLAMAGIGSNLSPSERWRLHFEAGRAELFLGHLKSGIDHLKRAHDLLPLITTPQIRNIANRTKFNLGVAFMRLGETENCCVRNSPDACILPIQGGGLHTNQEGSSQAIKYFSELLQSPALKNTEALNIHQPARWLLNIAYMTIGGYPHDVPKAHLIPPEVFQSDIDFPRFRNVHPRLGLKTFNLAGGVIVDDFNNDDYLDIVTSTSDTTGQTQFFRNNGDGTFSDQTQEAGLVGLYGGLNMVHADYDNDGDPDILILRGAWLGKLGRHANSLLRNNGDGTFTDVTFDSGLGRIHYPTKTAAWGDYDNDGDVDLYVGNEANQDLAAPSQLFRNNGDGTFTDVAAEAGLQEKIFAMGAVWGDYNDDRYLDLYVSVGGDNRLYRNNGNGTFTDVASSLNLTAPRVSFPVWFWDYNNDGVLDLFVSASSGPVAILALNPQGVDVPSTTPSIRSLQEVVQVEVMCLYRGDGQGSFDQVAREHKLTYPAQPMGANFGDLNNDGYLDFYLATGDVFYTELRPNVMFLNQGGNKFANVTMAGGFGHLQKGHGISFADLDNDGDLDVYAQMGGAVPGDKFNDALFENPGFGNHWITIKLVGRRSNRSAIGARILVRIDENGEQRSIYRHVNSGGSFGANPLRQTIGLGKATHISALKVFWPTTGHTQVFHSVAPDQIIQIVEDDDDYTPLNLKTFRLGG